jgi:hypothetical protein
LEDAFLSIHSDGTADFGYFATSAKNNQQDDDDSSQIRQLISESSISTISITREASRARPLKASEKRKKQMHE